VCPTYRLEAVEAGRGVWSTNDGNASSRINWLPLIGQRLETYADVLNVLALRTTTGVTENDGPAWGSPNGSRMGPLTVRLGVNFRY
jgi:hypothetical protein